VSLRATGPRFARPEDRLREAISAMGGRLPDVGLAPRDISIVVLLTDAIAVFPVIRDEI